MFGRVEQRIAIELGAKEKHSTVSCNEPSVGSSRSAWRFAGFIIAAKLF
jgi:hypothetical protein